MFSRSLFFVLVSISIVVASVSDPRSAAIEQIQKAYFNGKSVPLLATSEKNIPLQGSELYRVINPGSTAQGWIVWVNLSDGSAHVVDHADSLVSLIHSLKTPLSDVKLRSGDLEQARQISFGILHLYRASGANVQCSKVESTIRCSLGSSSQTGQPGQPGRPGQLGVTSDVTLRLNAEKGQISLVD